MDPLPYTGLKKWLKLEEGGGDRLSVFATTNSRHFPHSRWEPVLIGRGQELPLLDERLFLEGARVSVHAVDPNDVWWLSSFMFQS